MTELFENFEVNREPRWPIMSRLAVASLVLHAGLVAAAVYVPGVRSALNIAYMFSDARYVDEDYKRTEVGERAEIINLADEKFHYPEGYFAPPEQPMFDPLAPQIIAQTQPALSLRCPSRRRSLHLRPQRARRRSLRLL